jgi:hypothetical protein
VFLALCLAGAWGWTADTDLRPPPIVSDVGYLRVGDAAVSLPPDIPRVFIPPRSRLPLLAETAEEFLLLVPRESGAVVCRIPKLAKHQVLMVFEPERGDVLFRGAIEAKTTPFLLRPGEELAVLRQADDGTRHAALTRDGQEITLAIPAGQPGLAFSRDSAFAKFAEQQAEQGLAWLDGAWLPVAEAEARQAAAAEAENIAAERDRTMRAAAAQGVVVLKDGRVLQGTLRGNDREKILFAANGQEYWLAPMDLADLSVERMLARGRLKQVGRLLDQAEKACKEDPGKATYRIGQATATVKEIDPAAALDEAAEGVHLLHRATALQARIEEDLARTGRVIYRHTALPREDVAWHLAQGNILFRRQLWLQPNQVCTRCQGSGKLGCPECSAHGRIRQPCSICNGVGQLTCPICDGIGSKACPTCRGRGTLGRTCRRCNGRGSVMEYRYDYPAYGYGCNPQIIIGGRSNIVIPGRPFIYGGGYPMSVNCPRCGGSGREERDCPTCGGNGSVSCPKTVKCQACQGAGFTWATCPNCQGRKEIACDSCFGVGYLGKPQLRPSPEPAAEAAPAAPPADTLAAPAPTP